MERFSITPQLSVPRSGLSTSLPGTNLSQRYIPGRQFLSKPPQVIASFIGKSDLDPT
jgi:hypothetical protein